MPNIITKIAMNEFIRVFASGKKTLSPCNVIIGIIKHVSHNPPLNKKRGVVPNTFRNNKCNSVANEAAGTNME